MNKDPVIVIFIRFSFIGHSDWLRWRKAGNGSTEPAAVAAALYTDERMARRFWAFENFAMPSLLAQTDRDFKTVFLTSPQMPEPHLLRLQANAARLPDATVMVSEEPSVEEALLEPVHELNKAHKHLVQMRLDDDDALSVNFIARLREHAVKMASYKTYAISLSRGLTLYNWDGTPRALRVTHRPFLGIGTAARMPRGPSIFRFSHEGLSRNLPALQDARHINFFHQRWTGSDTDEGPDFSRKSEREASVEILRNALRSEFPFLAPLELLKPARAGGIDQPGSDTTPVPPPAP